MGGFNKATITHRETYQSLAKTNDSHVATAWKNAKGVQINENQELLDSWKNPNRTFFCFYGTKYLIEDRDYDNGHWLWGSDDKSNTLICARQFPKVWFVVSARISKPQLNNGKQKKAPRGFKLAEQAFYKINNEIWTNMEED